MTRRNAFQQILKTTCGTILIAMPLLAFGQERPAVSPSVPGEMLIGLKPGGFDAESSVTAVAGFGKVVGYSPSTHAIRVQLNGPVNAAWAANQAMKSNSVLYVEPNFIRHTFATPNDPIFSTYQYGPQITKASASWGIWQPKAAVTIAIVDTGIDYTHPDLADVMLKNDNGEMIGRNIQNPTAPPMDDNGHGTHCAGIAAARINNGAGIAGMAGWNPAIANSTSFIKLMPVKVLNKDGSGTDADVAEGITWAADHGAKVISLSLGGPSSSTTLNNACKYAWSKGCVIVGAAGNDGKTTKSYPGACDDVISVGASDNSDTIAFFSNYGSWVKVLAPGVGIASTYPGGKYMYMTGTSMATPHVAGEAAAIMSHLPDLNNGSVSQRIILDVDPYKTFAGHAIAAKAGRIDVYKALLGNDSAPTPPATAPTLLSVLAGPTPMLGGGKALGMVSLNGMAIAGGAKVNLSSSDSSVTVPASVTVEEGKLNGAFDIKTSSVSESKTVTITASLGDNKRVAYLKLVRVSPTVFSVSPSTVVGGKGAIGRIALNGRAPKDMEITLSSSNNAAAPPATVTIPKGAESVNFVVGTSAVGAATSVTLTATFGTGKMTAKITVVPILDSVKLKPETVKGGGVATVTVNLTAPAGDGGITIAMASGDGSVAPVPDSVTVPAGKKSVTFTIQTTTVSDSKRIAITGSFAGASRKANLYVMK